MCKIITVLFVFISILAQSCNQPRYSVEMNVRHCVTGKWEKRYFVSRAIHCTVSSGEYSPAIGIYYGAQNDGGKLFGFCECEILSYKPLPDTQND